MYIGVCNRLHMRLRNSSQPMYLLIFHFSMGACGLPTFSVKRLVVFWLIAWHNAEVQSNKYYQSTCRLVNPLRMRSRVTAVYLCVCVSVCYRSSCSSVDLCCTSIVSRKSTRYLLGFMRFSKTTSLKKMASFTFSIDTAICSALR